ncbi:hypothetical protein SCATT_p10050 (plasmid) [Streptantibioticus cattleyicolor NRRL 8057 = DSM 46488]|uniref:Uncharacterized protein n=1 Tax=Streptantibioticus cattleyicolor (strain ATCC 35852 / DSM 46488 / JCM 4925 / NBRC 14057 / NRRL 8057) TaxID=1003195 RepID=G8XDW3_STREN|nr:hypothetical protein SCATT_p10050 [Streptantibioticus cattleyicolor NRRL 8057 = DSM 46488]
MSMSSTFITAQVGESREVRAENCPNCGGPLAVNQDGWKICHACGYSSPSVAPAPVARGTVASTVS